MFTPLTEEHFTKLLKTAGTHLIFKHSPTCGISSRAYEHVTQRIKETHQPVFLLDVHQTPELKVQVTEELGIHHESPQLILIKNGLVEAVANHTYITANLLIERHVVNYG